MTDRSSAVVQWSTPRALGVFSGAVGVLCAVFALFTSKSTGTLLFAVGAVAFVSYATHVLRARPRLQVDAAGLTVRTTFSQYTWFHGQAKVFVRTTRRLGRDTHLVEIDGIDTDGEEKLVLLGRLDLGADPADVVDRITEIRATLPG